MKKIIYTLITIVAVWAIFIGFLDITNANTWLPEEIASKIVTVGVPISIIILIATIYGEIKSFIQSKIK